LLEYEKEKLTINILFFKTIKQMRTHLKVLLIAVSLLYCNKEMLGQQKHVSQAKDVASPQFVNKATQNTDIEVLERISDKDNKDYSPDWDSLRKHKPVPDWFRDAKLGIYAHWGVYSVPAFGNEWYPSYMFDKEGVRNTLKVYEHHVATYGDPSKFGYHDFVPMFRGEKFNAGEWADLYQKSGAKFGGTVTEHHDGFSMWASKVNPWNAKEMGPGRDVVGELEKAIRARGMKFITTMHHARMYGVRRGREYWTKAPDWPTTSQDPLLKILYGNIPFGDGIKLWRQKLDEVVTAFHPDMVWFDVDLELVPDMDKREFIAHYFNEAQKWGSDVVVTYKHNQLPSGIGLLDYENSRSDRLAEEPWLTDATIGIAGSVWSYVPGMKIKSEKMLLDSFLDIISKNGQLLLSISPRADGSIPEDQKQALLSVGQWLQKYGEAVYGTRPWIIYGEGKTQKSGNDIGFPINESEIRYTRNGNFVYASFLKVANTDSNLILNGFSESRIGIQWKVQDVSLLGSNNKIYWEQTDRGLIIKVPSEFPETTVNVFKIRCNH
jgi:alpha-L-fucosidase